ncbi:MAG TPA: GGDEF domain-containing protein [candidate division Zixibacteria bacterium]|nr:GGDEF domain-containing protein [candidate division Zixibacteria bacterium]
MMETVLRFLERRTKATNLALGILLMATVGALDFMTGREPHIHFFYLLPIALVSWFVESRAAIGMALACAVVWTVVGKVGERSYSSSLIEIWNFLMRAGILLTVAVALSQLRSKLDQISELASRDFLTGLPNGRAFYELAAREMDRAFGLEPIALAYIDVEGFKWINHRFGYVTGDQMLCAIAHTIRKNAPRADLVGRIGGTAFAVLLPNTEPEGARFVLEKMQGALREERRRYAQPVTFFISAIACAKAPRSVAELMNEAESRMTRMKSGNHDALEIATVESLLPVN